MRPDEQLRFPHQVAGAQAIIDKPGLILGYRPGRGKSRTVVDGACALYRDDQIDTVVVVAPANLRSIWLDPDPVLGEWSKWAWPGTPYTLIEYHAKTRIDRVVPEGLAVVVTNPEFLRRPERLNPLLAWVKTRRVLLVLDESWNFQSPRAQQTRAVWRLRQGCARVVLLNGTLGEIKHQFAQFSIVSPDVFNGMNWWQFRSRYCNTPDAPIWMADHTFKPIGDVQEGDEVIGWTREHNRSYLVKTRVLAKGVRVADNVVKVTLKSGRTLKCTLDHEWLNGSKSRFRDTGRWTHVVHAGPGPGSNRKGVLARIIDPPPTLVGKQRDTALWLAGLYDGEGHGAGIAQSKSWNPDVCARIEASLDELGIAWSEQISRSTTVVYRMLGGLQTYVNLLNWLPITRRKHLDRLVLESQLRGTKSTRAVMNIQRDPVALVEPLPPQDVVALETVSGNYIAWGYASSNCVMGGWQSKQITGYQREEEYAARTAPYVLLEDGGDDFARIAPPVRTTIEARLSPATWRIYTQLRDEFVAWLEGGTATALQAGVRALRLAQVANGFVGGVELEDGGLLEINAPLPTGDPITQELGREKLDALIQYITDAQIPSKLLIFTRFRPDVARTVRVLAETFPNHRVVPLYGQQPKDERDGAKRLLAPGGDPRPAIIVANAQSGGAGLNLTAASTCIFLGHDYALKTRRQAEGRIDRTGQTNRVTFTDIIAVGPNGEATIDRGIVTSLRRQKDLSLTTVEAWSKILQS